MITIINLKKIYKEKTVLDVPEFIFEHGRYALVGANGAGKSTLLKILGGIIKAESGKVIIDKTLDLVYMPQKSFGFNMSVAANLKITAKNFAEISDRLNLKPLEKKNAGKLSGGETQRVALARALLASSDILLLDEPTSAMDMENAVAAENLILEQQKPVLFATHSLAQAQRMADFIIYMESGKIIECLPCEKFILSQNPHTARFISRY